MQYVSSMLDNEIQNIIKTLIDALCGNYMKCSYFLPATVRA